MHRRAMSKPVESAVHTNAPKNTSFCSWLTPPNPGAKGTVSKNANKTCTPGSTTRNSCNSSASSRARRSCPPSPDVVPS